MEARKTPLSSFALNVLWSQFLMHVSIAPEKWNDVKMSRRDVSLFPPDSSFSHCTTLSYFPPHIVPPSVLHFHISFVMVCFSTPRGFGARLLRYFHILRQKVQNKVNVHLKSLKIVWNSRFPLSQAHTLDDKKMYAAIMSRILSKTSFIQGQRSQ